MHPLCQEPMPKVHTPSSPQGPMGQSLLSALILLLGLIWALPSQAKMLHSGDVVFHLNQGPLFTLPSPIISDGWQWEWRTGAEWSVSSAWSVAGELILQQGFPWGVSLGLGPKLRMTDLGVAWSPWLQGQGIGSWLHPGSQDIWLWGTRWMAGLDWFVHHSWLLGAGIGVEMLIVPHGHAPYGVLRLPLQLKVAWIWQAEQDD